MAMRFNRNVNINRVVRRLVKTVIALYVGGTILTELGSVMNGTASSMYGGLELIGWDVAGTSCTGTGTTICSTTGSGILVVIGIIAIAQIVTEFISW